jgi:hypothetical protein
MNEKAVVMHDNKIINNEVIIDLSTKLLSNGMIVWSDKSTTLLRIGDCIDGRGIIYSERDETDFIGDSNALNHIHMLPELTVTGEKKVNSSSSLNESDRNNYIHYLEKLYKDFELNDFDIAFIKDKLRTKTRNEVTQYRKKLNTLEKENVELKIDYDIFIHYGEISDWKLFRKEMNEDLISLVQDLSMMKEKLKGNVKN